MSIPSLHTEDDFVWNDESKAEQNSNENRTRKPKPKSSHDTKYILKNHNIPGVPVYHGLIDMGQLLLTADIFVIRARNLTKFLTNAQISFPVTDLVLPTYAVTSVEQKLHHVNRSYLFMDRCATVPVLFFHPGFVLGSVAVEQAINTIVEVAEMINPEHDFWPANFN